ncbi:hypothetical protein CDO44_24440 [Pigmentiphaga sp. NML080357]|uniref:glutamate cyclase domain-containing protein n=1 Tax=Pigmentiphaga sp. NML080357 TaxID=2008675 RepID=UPI000B41430F|nr:glutamate cyclase domain-containing protein [Pigmentiphaga sp. NML080357]OVZ55364.1 hypothetical protein CDO44_24440 [Pigmentiphaga sp. NML080357]
MPDIIGEYVDRLVTVEMRNRAMNHNIIGRIYEQARAEGGGRPISARAAQALVERVRPGDRVLIVTGAGYAPEAPNGESDGPPGAAALAHALFWGLRAVPVFVTEPCHAPPVVASSRAAGIMVRDYELCRDRRMGAALAVSPERQDEVRAWAAALLDEYRPSAILAVERLGPNEQGVIHYSTGVRPEHCIDLAPLFELAAERRVLSIGIGDNGNEIGFGRIFAFMKDFHPYGRRCQYPGGAGVPTVVPTDIFLPASISNWGAYGLSAMLAFLCRRLDVLHTPAIERDILRACLDAGGWEMRYCTSRFIVDGTEGESSMAIIQLLRDMVRVNIAQPDRGLSHGTLDH